MYDLHPGYMLQSWRAIFCVSCDCLKPPPSPSPARIYTTPKDKCRKLLGQLDQTVIWNVHMTSLDLSDRVTGTPWKSTILVITT